MIAHILDDRSPRGRGQGVPGGRASVAAQIEADRYYAVHVLARLADRRAVDLLIPLLTDRDVNYKVAWALGEIGDPVAIQPLIRALRAIDALAKLDAKEAVIHLRGLLNDQALPRAGDPVSVAESAKQAIVALERAR